jgi:hypothetical protein
MAPKSSEIVVERWESDQNNHEVHLFVREDGHERYLIGFNPELIPAWEVALLLRSHSLVWDHEKDMKNQAAVRESESAAGS